MKIEEMNEGRKIGYETDGTKLDFAGGALTVDLDRYRRDYPVTKDVMADADGNLLLGSGGRYYVAQVGIPANTYTPAAQENTPVEQGEEKAQGEAATLDPLNMDEVTLRLWSIAGITIF